MASEGSYDYVKTVWENGVTPINDSNLNKVEDQLGLVSDGVATIGDLDDLETTSKENLVGAINEVKSNNEPIVLWTNPNPNNGFAPQQITLSSADYNYLEIYYYDWGVDSVSWKDLKCVKTLKGYNTVLEAIISYSSRAYIGTRRARYINNTNLQFDSCYALVNESAFSNIISNAWCLPIKILGYK